MAFPIVTSRAFDPWETLFTIPSSIAPKQAYYTNRFDGYTIRVSDNGQVGSSVSLPQGTMMVLDFIYLL